MLIRAFTRQDQAAARRLILAGLGEHFGVIDPSANPDLDDIWASYPGSGHVFCVVDDYGVIVGTGALLGSGSGGQIARVSVVRDHRRSGIGRGVVQHLLAEARRLRLARVWMETNDDWHAAIALYVSCGFVEYDRRDGCVFMACDLAPRPGG
jgi:ribosomal protein S18 acetylase RimI-like enzyme